MTINTKLLLLGSSLQNTAKSSTKAQKTGTGQNITVKLYISGEKELKNIVSDSKRSTGKTVML